MARPSSKEVLSEGHNFRTQLFGPFQIGKNGAFVQMWNGPFNEVGHEHFACEVVLFVP